MEVSKMEQDCLAELKRLINESDNKRLKDAVDDDEFLRAFIIGRKYNVQHAFETAKGHMNAKYGKYKEVFAIPPIDVEHVLKSGVFAALKNRDSEGRLVGILRIPKLDIKTMEFSELLRAAILQVDYFWKDRTVSEKGQMFIVDYTGYNLSIFTRYSFSQKLSFVTLFLNNYPTKVKQLHIYNNPRMISYFFSFLRPFLPEKLRKRFYLHGPNMTSIHKHISPDILPTWLGGKLSDEEALDPEIVQDILSRQSAYELKKVLD